MRPTRIEVEGFSAYRSRVEVDLEEVEFFALSGPTGAGKSSLIDAMIFALYGRVPRLAARAVAPVITAGADRARVAVEFEVDGRGYIASRVAERTETGASVREARLETADGSPVASGSSEVTNAIEDLLKLRFDDFTKTVVLPQGEFARFLNAGSKERRDLLRDLLGLEMYSRMRELATVRKSVASERLAAAGNQLESIEIPSESDLESATVLVSDLEELALEIDDQTGALDELNDELVLARQQLSIVEDAVERLEDLRPPDHLDRMEERLADARDAQEHAEQALSEKRDAIASAEKRLADLPGEDAIEAVRSAHQELRELNERLERLGVDSVQERVDDLSDVAARAQEQLDTAEAELATARTTHAAHVVAGTLEKGQPCPVCTSEVVELPELSRPESLSKREQAVERAKESYRQARDRLESARIDLSEVTATRTTLSQRRDRLTASIAGATSFDELEETAEQREKLSRQLVAARTDLTQLEEMAGKARRRLEDESEAARTVGRALMVAREHIADLKPPQSESDDPAVQWKDLLTWRDERLEGLAADRQSLLDGVGMKETEVTQRQAELVSRLESAGVPAEPPYAVQVARQIEIARQRVEKIQDLMVRVAELRSQIDDSRKAEAVASALAGHLKANGFERWLMAGAISELVVGANDLLSQLSGGGYSLEADAEGSFRIIDHRNADELRDIATLSGGETFLVSLALSLSLAETLSGKGGAGLEAIILDEGFGTLDEESLDVVASVLEELAGRGLMVGVITHVKELAARAPVRYQVTREPDGSKVEVIT